MDTKRSQVGRNGSRKPKPAQSSKLTRAGASPKPVQPPLRAALDKLERASRRRLGGPVAEWKLVRVRECPMDNPVMGTPEDIARVWREHVPEAAWYSADAECLCVFLLNVRRRLMGFHLVSTGTVDSVLAHPREVFRLAIACGASAMVMAHNL